MQKLNNIVELSTKIAQNWVKVSSWASLDGLAVLGVSDMVDIQKLYKKIVKL